MSSGNIFLSILKGILMFFGVLFIILIIGVVYFIWADPLDIKQYFSAFKITQDSGGTDSADIKSKTQEITDNPLLNDEQEATLRKIGVDPATLPTAITPEMEKCFTATLGSDRVREIVAGAAPSTLELLKAKSCL